MLRKESRYNLYLYAENKKSREWSIYRLDDCSVPIMVCIILIIVPSVIITTIIVYVNDISGKIIAASFALALYCILILLGCLFICYYTKCTLGKRTEPRTIHADNPMEDEYVLEELICRSAIKREKSMQTNTTIQKFTTGNITMEDDSCIPRLTPEEEKYYNIIQGKVRGRVSTGSRSIASNTTGFVSMLPEDVSEQIGSSTSKSMVLENTVLEGHNINVSADVVVHSPFYICQNSFDTDSLETQVVK